MQKLLNNEKFDVAVLMGGVSNEREISLKSGRAVAEALGALGHRVSAIDLRQKKIDAVIKADPDIAFIALHGEFGEDGHLQAMLDDASIPYTGSDARASRIGMDKKASKRAYLSSAVPTPAYSVVVPNMPESTVMKQADAIGYPMVSKPVNGGSSKGVNIVHHKDRLQEIIEKWRAAEDGELILEKYIYGRELTVGILDGEPLPFVEIVSHTGFFDYRAKYEDNNTEYHVPVSLIESVYRKICDAAVRAYHATGCRHMARVDLIYGYDGGVYVLEINTIPGMTSRSLLPMAAAYSGIEFPALCHRLCLMAAADGFRMPQSSMIEKRKKSA